MLSWWNLNFESSAADAAWNAVRSRSLSQGPVVRQLESEIADYFGVKHVIACSSGTAALMLAMASAGVGPESQVVMPDRSWIATAHAAHWLGAEPVFIECDQVTGSMDTSRVEDRLCDRVRAIVAVHLNGRVGGFLDLQQIAMDHGVPLIEDAAQAFGSRTHSGQLLGSIGDVGCFSLSVTKAFSAGQGGFCITENDSLAQRIRSMRTHGVESTTTFDSWVMPGFNFRMTDVTAAIAREQLKVIETTIARLRHVHDLYQVGLMDLSSVRFVPSAVGEGEVSPYVEVLANQRSSMVEYLSGQGIEVRPFYPGMSTASYWRRKTPPCADSLSTTGLWLPSGPSLSDANIKFVCDMVRAFDESL